MLRLIIVRNPSIFVANVTEKMIERGTKEPKFTSDFRAAKKFHSLEKAQDYRSRKSLGDKFRIMNVLSGGRSVDITDKSPADFKASRRKAPLCPERR